MLMLGYKGLIHVILIIDAPLYLIVHSSFHLNVLFFITKNDSLKDYEILIVSFKLSSNGD